MRYVVRGSRIHRLQGHERGERAAGGRVIDPGRVPLDDPALLVLGADQIRPAPDFNAQIDADYITGLGTVKVGDSERMLILMDIEQLLAGAA